MYKIPVALTIAIPTYNRAIYLNDCLNSIFKQIKNYKINILVSDNCSTDNTENIVQNYIKNGNNILYIKNKTNIGPDRNIIQCITSSTSDYVLVLGDDDIIADGGLKIIYESLLSKNEYGIVFVNSGYIKTQKNNTPIIVYDNKIKFVSKINYFLTFISTNIVNKKFINFNNINRDIDTNLNQVHVYLEAIFNAPLNAIITPILILNGNNHIQYNNYNFFEVFGTNFNLILDRNEKYRKELKNIINKNLINTFFIGILIALKKEKIKINFIKILKIMLPIYYPYFKFWYKFLPILFCPISIIQLILKIKKRINMVNYTKNLKFVPLLLKKYIKFN